MREWGDRAKCGLIAALAIGLQKSSPQFGKTVLQKMVYLLQEVYQVDMGYNFRFHTFGPFSDELLADLDFANFCDVVNVENADGNYGYGYRIKPGELANDYAMTFKNSLTDEQLKFDALVKGFGCKKAKDLELLTTIIFLNNELKLTSEKMERATAIKKIIEIKPRFTNSEVHSAMNELETKHGLQLCFENL